jgi:peroxiredoxin
MGGWRRSGLILGAALCWSAALLIGAVVGLPERAAFTGVVIPGERPIAPEIGAVAPPFSGLTVAGERLDLWALHGKPIILNFWATWCEPCALEMPELQALYAERGAEQVRVLAVNLGEGAAQVQAWGQHFGLTFDLLLDPTQQVAALYHLRGQPSTYVISAEGVITHIFYGPTTAAALRGAL